MQSILHIAWGMHFTLFVPWLVKGGADRCGLDVVRAVREANPDAVIDTVICRSNVQGNMWQHKFEQYGNVIDLSPHWYDNNSSQAILDYLRKASPTHVMINNAHEPYLMLESMRRAIPNAYITALVHMDLPGAWDFPATISEKHEYLDCVFTVSEKLAKSMAMKGVPAEKLVPLHWFGYKDTPTEFMPVKEVRKRIGIEDPDTKIILFPFRISPQKRPGMIIPIMALLRRYMNCVAVVAGSGNMERVVRAAAEKAGIKIFWLGAVDPDDMHHLYRAAFCTVTPSQDEGIPLVYFECQQVGCPVIASDVGAVSELLGNQSGVLIKYEEDVKSQSEAYGSAVYALLKKSGLRERLVERGLKNVERFSYSRWKTTLMNKLSANVVSFGVNQPHHPPRGGKVFVIGAPKTGTSSMGRALEKLGYHDYNWDPQMQDYYHMGNHPPIWECVGRFDSFSDGPFNTGDFYKVLFDRFPDAKFILTTRDKEAWKASFKAHYAPTTRNDNVPRRYRMHKFVEDDWWTWYDRRNAEIENFFHQKNSPNRLLKVQIDKEDPTKLWLRLSQFLGVPVPIDIKTFPHENKTK